MALTRSCQPFHPLGAPSLPPFMITYIPGLSESIFRADNQIAGAISEVELPAGCERSYERVIARFNFTLVSTDLQCPCTCTRRRVNLIHAAGCDLLRAKKESANKQTGKQTQGKVTTRGTPISARNLLLDWTSRVASLTRELCISSFGGTIENHADFVLFYLILGW